MTVRQDITPQEAAVARAFVSRTVAAWKGLAAAARADSTGTSAQSAGEMEPRCAEALVLSLDRFVTAHGRPAGAVTAADELALVATAVMSPAGRFVADDSGEYVPDQSVLGLLPGEPVRSLRMDSVERLAVRVLAEVDAQLKLSVA
ncbi:hypothetical protein SAMN06264364_14021 [Quadrisphaera granulorum]|uniref:Uncharacterized protein n=1 Tax=Quadrisphaera granulorum TaxID=317664 RepID=A0A316ABL1_9ACTN|nr:hypothetical protein [Quadrisphaera granulorum]PWJ47207.1 hypothetical protein BXY45_14021 [Quadrisphaera granulorum]SZE98893.1 hypothetical protein SAMN06264364_14021 [Quadrisphaera granulorum]